MSVYDYEAAPPPPRYQAKAVKDKSLKDEVLYRTEFYMPSIKRWDATCLLTSKKAAKRNKKKCQERIGKESAPCIIHWLQMPYESEVKNG